MTTQDRRSFLKRAGIAAASVGLASCTTTGTVKHLRGGALGGHRLGVRVNRASDPLVARAFAIMKDRIQQRCSVEVVQVDKDPAVILDVDGSLPKEAFRIDQVGHAVRVAGGSPQGLMYGIGKFLRTSTCGDTFVPSAWRGTSEPQGTMRGIYFASHFHNWYHQASPPEIARYMEDLTLWGVNAVMVVFPMINLQDWNDPQAEPAMAMVRQYAKTARELGLQFVTGLNNTMFIGAPQDIRATKLADPTGRRGNSGHPICPSNPAGHAYLMANSEELFRKLSDVGLDVVCFWPYDEGGCACEKCMPWGSNGYLRLSSDMAALGRRYFPNLKTILSTWMFDTPPEGEWQGLADYLQTDGAWLDYILADSHEDFPRYPLEHGVPGKRPLLNFPEISMWGNSPWGGYGAHPLPARFQRLWDQVKNTVTGGFPYSEGIYEDMSKCMEFQFYWNRDTTARATLAEYAEYEFGSGSKDDVLALVDLLEAAATSAAHKQPTDKEGVQRAFALAESLNGRMPEWAKKNWRWEILHLRAVLDNERFAGGGLKTPTAEAALARLIEIYHCQMETNDPYHHRVRPASSRAVSRTKEL